MIDRTNNSGFPRIYITAIIIGILSLLVSVRVSSGDERSCTKRRTVTDMGGRTVYLPESVRRVVTIGGAPIINTFIFALGKGETIVNGPNASARASQKDCCRFQGVFAPRFNAQPSIESANGIINAETLLSLKPDLIITCSRKYVDYVEKLGIPVLYIQTGKTGNKNREIMTLLGRAYNQQIEAQRYIRYFDSVIRRVTDKISGVPEKQRVKVLYCNAKTMKQSSPIADWWIETAGGISLGKGGPTIDDTRSLSAEHVLAWNPDVWIVSAPEEIEMIYSDPQFRGIKAVKNENVFSIPTGALRWSHPTSEQPLGVLWVAKLFYPERFNGVSIEQEAREFYRTFFKYELTSDGMKKLFGRTRR